MQKKVVLDDLEEVKPADEKSAQKLKKAKDAIQESLNRDKARKKTKKG